MKTIGWATNVNDRIIEETTISIGENGFVEDKESNGYEERRLTALAIPDTFNVVMDFDWGGQGSEYQYPADPDGTTEYDRFVKWYKFVHKRGSNPFWFPCITKHSVDNMRNYDKAGMCLYKITSALSPQKSGYSMRISMTWKEVYSGIIEVPIQHDTIDHITASLSNLNVHFVSLPQTVPTTSNIVIKHGYVDSEGVWHPEDEPITIKDIRQRERYFKLSFDEITPVIPSGSRGYKFKIESDVYEINSDSYLIIL